MCRIFITGDTHGQIDWGKFSTSFFPAQKLMSSNDYVIICGDFGGVWDLGDSDKFTQSVYNDRNFTTLFVDGNHENHQALDSYPVEMWNGGKVHKISDKIIHLMRGQVYEIGGKKFFTMGGAESTDKKYRRENISWWPREMPSDEEYKEALINLEKHNFKVDYVITHCGPEDTLEFERQCNRLTCFFDDLINVYNLTFSRWFCGHYHTDWTYKNITVLYNKIFEISSDIENL